MATASLLGTKDSRCFVCGPDIPLGLRVPFHPREDGGSEATYTARPEHGGWNGILHGAIALALMDEAFGWSIYFLGTPAVTARMETRFLQPVPIGTTLRITANVTGQRRHLYDARAEVRDAVTNQLYTEATAVMAAIQRSDV